MRDITPSKVRYIKLGRGGKWEKECIEDSHALRIGFRETDHDLCLASKWRDIRNDFLKWDHDSRTSTRLKNEVKEFYEADKTVLWITFYKGLLWWCFSESVITRMPDKTKTRPAIGGWKCKSIDGRLLDFKHLSGELLKKRMFNGTICKVNESYVLKKINGHGGTLEVGADESVVEALEKSYAKSQGFLLDSKTRKALEIYAMEAAKRYFTSLSYAVKDHSKGHPYDLLCTRKKELLYVEVKGTQTNGDGIILTSGEVRFARRQKGQMALFILHSIQVAADGKLSNGQKKVNLSWDVDKGKLKPVSFIYEVP